MFKKLIFFSLISDLKEIHLFPSIYPDQGCGNAWMVAWMVAYP